jgi:hypothetical protein
MPRVCWNNARCHLVTAEVRKLDDVHLWDKHNQSRCRVVVYPHQQKPHHEQGLTRNGTPELRAQSYSEEHDTEELEVYWQSMTLHVGAAEAQAHNILASYRRETLTSCIMGPRRTSPAGHGLGRHPQASIVTLIAPS